MYNHDPIGYNIFIPEGEIKAVYVEVYGGRKAAEAKEFTNLPYLLTIFDKPILKQGIALVKLNLVDLIELKVQQASMPKEFFYRQHELMIL